MTLITYERWLAEVRTALDSINMSLDEWQKLWPFSLKAEYNAGTPAADAAAKANRFWWQRQNISLNQNCQISADCWLPRGHSGTCKPVSLA